LQTQKETKPVTQGSHLLPPPLAGRDNVLTHVCLFVSRITQKVMAEFFMNLGKGPGT